MRLPYNSTVRLFVKRESVRPIFKPLDQSGTNGILRNIQPFTLKRFV